MDEYIPDNGWGGRSKYQYADLRPMPLFLINGSMPPANFKFGYTETTEQLVKSQRNSRGVVIAKKIGEEYDNSTGKRLLKFDALEWPILTNEEYRWLQNQIEKFYCYVTFYDARKGYHPPEVNQHTKEEYYQIGELTDGGVVTKKFYWGDFSAEPFRFERDPQVGVLVPSHYINVKVNLIDCGEPYLERTDPNWCDPTKFIANYYPTDG